MLENLAEDGDTTRAASDSVHLLVEAALFVPVEDQEAFAEAGFARWLTAAINKAEVDDPATLTARLLARPKAARELAYLLLDSSRDDLPEVFALFLELEDTFGEMLDVYPGLTAALCVVHDRKIERRINENTVAATDPVDLFRFYTANEGQMLFGLRDVPGPLLVWVVDSTASIDEMAWALREYAGDRAIGRRFFDIKYDHDHFRRGTPKKVTQAGFSLPNIRRYGGVCADQAYFAVAVGKAIGVPTTYTVGRDGDVGHAWVGYFEQRGRRGGWNFDEGRYSTYQGVRGVVEHPQYGVKVDDSFVSVLAEAITLPPTQRYAAAGLVEAAALLGAVSRGVEFTVEAFTPPISNEAEAPVALRSASIDDRLALIRSGLTIDPGFAAGWTLVAGMAGDGRLDLSKKRRWAESVTRLCGDRYPDFAVTVLRPIIASIEDPALQSDLWEAAYQRFRARKDLAAEIRMTQGALWEAQDAPRKAAGYYEDIIRKHANDGPFVIEALERFEELLVQADRPQRIVVLYREAFRALDRPDAMARQFAQQSNYYRVGTKLVQQLRESGNARDAEKLENEIVNATGLQANAS